MKRILALILTLALSVSVSASALAASAEKVKQVRISTTVSEKEYKTPGGQVVMTIHTEVPVFSGGPSKAATDSVNAYYRALAKDYVASLEKEYLKDAIAEADLLKKRGVYYGFYKSFSVTYNANGLLSVFFNDSYDLTGAHPTSLFNAQTFDMRTGKQLAQGGILPDVSATMQKLFKKVNAYLKENELTQFALMGGNSLEKLYNKSDFVLTGKGISFFFQQYAIAPYAAGMSSFELTYKELGALLIPAKAASVNASENELREVLSMRIDDNLSVARDMFFAGTLKTELGVGTLRKVNDVRFATYKGFKDYLGRTYTKKCVEQLLKASWYVDYNGKLYVDTTKVKTKPLSGDRSNYTYTLSNVTKSAATLSVYLTDSSGAQKKINVPMKKEGGRWLLEAMF